MHIHKLTQQRSSLDCAALLAVVFSVLDGKARKGAPYKTSLESLQLLVF